MTIPMAILIISGIALVPGYVNFFFISTMILAKRDKNDNMCIPYEDVTILIACRNESENIYETLKYIAKQKYCGNIYTIVIDNGSTDGTGTIAQNAGKDFDLNLEVISEERKGKHNALNTGLRSVFTKYVITIDGDTILHELAITNLVRRMLLSNGNVTAVAGHIFAANSKDNITTKMQTYDYFLSIGPIKKIQSTYKSTLVAQGAFSIYKTQDLEDIGGWPNSIGEDIVLSWRLLKNNYEIIFEPYAVAFTQVPTNIKSLAKQRIRWARGMIEALKKIKPWEQPSIYTKFLTGINMILPFLDISYVFFFVPGLILACMGIYWVTGIFTLLVLPMVILQNYIYYIYQRDVCRNLNIGLGITKIGFVGYILVYQFMMSWMSIIGYFQEMFNFRRQWRKKR